MSVAKKIVPASEGSGPLLQRDYWVVLDECGCPPQDLIERVRNHFCDLAPRELAQFVPAEKEFGITIALAGKCHVRRVHDTPTSFTLRTLEGHPEAGRITFGASRLSDGRVEFRIRSRARASSAFNLIGWYMIGKSMQTDTWVEFVTRVAKLCNGKSKAGVQVAEETVDEKKADGAEFDSPTFQTVEG